MINYMSGLTPKQIGAAVGTLVFLAFVYGVFKFFASLDKSHRERTIRHQRELLEKALDNLILKHENKLLVCTQIIVGDIYKEFITFDQMEFYDDGDNKQFLGAWRKIPVFHVQGLGYSTAAALSDRVGYPITSMSEMP